MGYQTHRSDVQAEALGLYLSVPFCRSKCTFCNFASGVYPASKLQPYLSRLLGDLAGAPHLARAAGLRLPQEVDTVYLGGGTPSVLTGAQLRTIFTSIRERFAVAANAEITLEAAPATLTDDLLAAALEAGVTRISFGVQTFVDAEARAIGRLHTSAQAFEDLARIRAMGFASSVDLIAGLPGQTERSWQQSLAALAEARPEHASIYMLEVDQGSRLGGEMLLGGSRYGAALAPSDDAVADFYLQASEALEAQGLGQYEISNFARPGQQSRHNLRYWRRRPYLGVGLDAHSMLRDEQGRAVRFGSGDDLDTYLKVANSLDDSPGGAPATERPWRDLEPLDQAAELEEAWFLGLRCTDGVRLGELEAEFGSQALVPCLPVIEALVYDGLLTSMEGCVCLTARGRLLSNDVFAAFLGLAQEVPRLADETGREEMGAMSAVAR